MLKGDLVLSTIHKEEDEISIIEQGTKKRPTNMGSTDQFVQIQRKRY